MYQYQYFVIFLSFFYSRDVISLCPPDGLKDATASVPVVPGTTGDADYRIHAPFLFIIKIFDIVLIFILYVHSSLGLFSLWGCCA